jgi:Transposase DDE domain group 1
MTNRTDPLELVEAEHRGHAVVELAIGELKDQALAHFPSAKFLANAAWAVIAALAHNLLRWTTIIGPPDTVIPTARTVRRRLLTVPGRITHTARRVTLRPPAGPGRPRSSPPSRTLGALRSRRAASFSPWLGDFTSRVVSRPELLVGSRGPGFGRRAPAFSWFPAWRSGDGCRFAAELRVGDALGEDPRVKPGRPSVSRASSAIAAASRRSCRGWNCPAAGAGPEPVVGGDLVVGSVPVDRIGGVLPGGKVWGRGIGGLSNDFE